MKPLLRPELKELLGKPTWPAISLFMPTQRTGDTVQGPIRLDNLHKKAEGRLVELGMRAPDAKKLLSPVHDLLLDALFWRNQGNGLALFLSPGVFRYYRGPYTLEEAVYIGDQFLTMPLLELFFGDRMFYIMALSQKSVRVFQATRDGFRTIDPPGMPHNMDEALKLEFPGKQFSSHSVPGTSGRIANAVFSGSGGDISYSEEDLKLFLKMVNRGLHEAFKEESAPLILASVEYLQPLYQQVNTYNHLLPVGLHGNADADQLTDEDLHRLALPVAQRYFESEKVKVLKLYSQLAGVNQATSDLKKVVLAAGDGIIWILFVAPEAKRWGVVDLDQRRVTLHDKPEAGDQELLEFITGRTLLTGGTVYTLEADKLPDGSPASAILRYASPTLFPPEQGVTAGERTVSP
ncbi:MAG: hypothetical protein HYX87_01115 [Chloroflexi bacterium]|nr:hypothetical protein [Chloroflexota bacterium]